MEGNNPVEGATLDFELLFEVPANLTELVLELGIGLRRRLKLVVSIYDCKDVSGNDAEAIPLKTELSFKVTVRRIEFKSEEWFKLLETDIISVVVMFNTELSLEVVINFWEEARFEPALGVTL